MLKTEGDADYSTAKKNIYSQATNILRTVVDAYLDGSLDDPQKSFLLTNLLACICEGKVKGLFDEESGLIHWSLTKEYQDHLELQVEAFKERGLSMGNIIPGPWT